MPASRSRRKWTAKPKTHDQLLRAELRRQRAPGGGRHRRLAGVALLVVGALLLVDSFVGRARGPTCSRSTRTTTWASSAAWSR